MGLTILEITVYAALAIPVLIGLAKIFNILKN